MPQIILDLGFLKVSASYLQRRSSGRFYYYRRIPGDLRGHYGKSPFRVVSLKTTDALQAVKKAATLASQDDSLWTSLRTPTAQDMGLTTPEAREGAKALMAQWGLSDGDGHRAGPDAHRQVSAVVDILDDYFIGRYGAGYEQARMDDGHAKQFGSPQSFYSPVEAEAVRRVMSDPSKPRILLSDALSDYLKSHKRGGNAKFINDNTTYIGKVTATVGDLPLSEYRREHANKVKERLIASGIATSTVRRTLNAITAVFNHGLREFDLRQLGNPFEGLQIAKEGEDIKSRNPFTSDELKAVGKACKDADDDIRRLIAMQVDTGARIAEIVGLRIEDIALDHEVPHVWIRPHPKLGRSLKNDNSERKVPLVGLALWGAQRAREAHGERSQGWLFPRYAADNDIKATHASNAVNKWFRKALEINKTSHSLRHSMRDRLRHVCFGVQV